MRELAAWLLTTSILLPSAAVRTDQRSEVIAGLRERDAEVDPCLLEVQTAWVRDALGRGRSLVEAIGQLPSAWRGGVDVRRPRLEVWGLRSEDPLDRRVAELVGDVMVQRCIGVVSAEEARSAGQADADLAYLAGVRPEEAREILRRRVGDLVLGITFSGGKASMERVYGVTTHSVGFEATASLVRTIDGIVVGSARHSASARRLEANAAAEVALEVVIDAVSEKMADLAWREIARAEGSVTLLVESGEDATDLRRVLASAGLRTESSLDAVMPSIRVLEPPVDLPDRLRSEGWGVLDRRLDRWRVRRSSSSAAGVIWLSAVPLGAVLAAWLMVRRRGLRDAASPRGVP